MTSMRRSPWSPTGSPRPTRPRVAFPTPATYAAHAPSACSRTPRLPRQCSPSGRRPRPSVAPRSCSTSARKPCAGWSPSAGLRGSQARTSTTRTTSRPVLEQQIRDWCGRTDTQLTVLPVVDLADHESVDRYEVSDRLQTRVGLLTPTCVFPWCARPARRCDKDHVIAHGDGGATCSCNLAPLCRRHHRLKTRAGWRYRPVESGVWLWSDPHGQSFLRDARGTTDITPVRGAREGPGRDTGCRRG